MNARHCVVILSGAGVARVWSGTWLTELSYLVTALLPGTQVTVYCDTDNHPNPAKWTYTVPGKESAKCT